jgi:hypothetical protein
MLIVKNLGSSLGRECQLELKNVNERVVAFGVEILTCLFVGKIIKIMV